MGISDSGLGMAAGLYVNDRVNVLGIVSDANADRFDFGDIDEVTSSLRSSCRSKSFL
jgi:hypothetical protein